MPITRFKVDDINSAVSEYYALRERKKVIDARMKSLSERIKSYSQSHGATSDTGSYYCENDTYYFGSVSKKSVSLDQEKALQYLKSHGMEDAIKSVEVVDEQVLEQYIADGSITAKDIESISSVKSTYSLDVKKKEEVPDIQQVPLAASRRGRK